MIKIKNVNYRYKNNKDVLENINLEIGEGECICIVGENGAGKSTLVKLIAGIIKPTIGEILVDEIRTSEKAKTKELRKKVGIVFQNPENQIVFSKVYDDIAFGIKNLNLSDEQIRIEKSLEMVGMKEASNKNADELSLGQKQRITIAGILAINTKHVILDEATSMLDTQTKEDIYGIIENLKKVGKTVIFTTNIADEMLIADRIIILNNSQIVAEVFKKDIENSLEVFKKYRIRLPKILEIAQELKNKGIEIKQEQFTTKELVEKIIEKRKIE